MQKCGALWEKTTKKGDTFLSGIIGGKKIVAFRNSYKQGNQPDWNVFPEQSREQLPPKDEEEVPF